MNQPFIPGIYAVRGDEKIKRRGCQVCVQDGCDGILAKGRITVKIVSLKYFSNCLLTDTSIDRHDYKKYNKYRTSTLKFLIVLALVVNKTVICE